MYKKKPIKFALVVPALSYTRQHHRVSAASPEDLPRGKSIFHSQPLRENGTYHEGNRLASVC